MEYLQFEMLFVTHGVRVTRLESGEIRCWKYTTSRYDYEVFYSGQNQGRLDHQLVDAVNSSSTFRVYYRIKSNSSFIFFPFFLKNFLQQQDHHY